MNGIRAAVAASVFHIIYAYFGTISIIITASLLCASAYIALNMLKRMFWAYAAKNETNKHIVFGITEARICLELHW